MYRNVLNLSLKGYWKIQFIERNNAFVKIKCQKYAADNEKNGRLEWFKTIIK